MGEDDDAREYDQDLIFKHLYVSHPINSPKKQFWCIRWLTTSRCFYLDSPDNARKNEMTIKSDKNEAEITTRYTSFLLPPLSDSFENKNQWLTGFPASKSYHDSSPKTAVRSWTLTNQNWRMLSWINGTRVDASRWSSEPQRSYRTFPYCSTPMNVRFLTEILY